MESYTNCLCQNQYDPIFVRTIAPNLLDEMSSKVYEIFFMVPKAAANIKGQQDFKKILLFSSVANIHYFSLVEEES